jgi:hypothetical protein
MLRGVPSFPWLNGNSFLKRWGKGDITGRAAQKQKFFCYKDFFRLASNLSLNPVRFRGHKYAVDTIAAGALSWDSGMEPELR